jgi:hypothetical protein
MNQNRLPIRWQAWRRGPAASGLRAGLTFAEVMFAIITLGIGFIFIAAMLPVGIKQTQATTEETVATSVGPAAVRIIQGVATSANLPPTTPAGAFVDLRSAAPDVWRAIRPSVVNSWDPRYAWVPLYRRDYGDSFATVIIVVVQSRLRERYLPSRDVMRWPTDSGGTPAVLEPKSVTLSFTTGVGTAPDRVTVSGSGADAVNTGAYLVLAQDSGAGGQGNGRIVRVGRPVSGNTWELVPGEDLKGSAYKPSGGTGFVVGKAWSDPASPGTYEGPAQDVGAFVSYVWLD